jgi:hypothetical protein
LNELFAEPDKHNPVYSSLAQIPESEVRRFSLVQSHKVEPVEENNSEATTAVTTAEETHGNMHVVRLKDQSCQDEEVTLEFEFAAADPTSGSEHDVNVLLSTFGSYKKQDLGTPRKISRQIKPVSASDENTPPQQSESLPILKRKPEWAGKDSETPGSADVATMAQN